MKFINILLFAFSFCGLQAQSSISINTVNKNSGMNSESYLSATFNGSWCWFSDPRAVYYEGKYQRTYMGWIDNWGNIIVGFYDHATTRIETHVIATGIEIDDHNTPSLFFDETGHLMVTYNQHMMPDMPLYLVKAKNTEDISEWEDTQILRFNDIKYYPELGNKAKHCYTNPIKLSKENGKLYLFWRGHDGKPTFTTSPDNGKTWDAGQVYFMPYPIYKFRRPYTKIYSNNTDKIHFVFTDGHPRDEKMNSIYYAAYKNNAFYKANGEKITDISHLPMLPAQTDMVYNATVSGVKAWNWDVAEDKNGYPIIAYAKFPNDSTHIYCYARWDGKKWLNFELINSGGWFPKTQPGKVETEPNYSGGMSIDKENPNTLYLSVKRNAVFEIEKWVTSNGGKSWKVEFITKGSTKDNVRPFAIRGAKEGNPLQVLWMQNTQYIHFHATRITQWDNRFQSAIKMNIPSPNVSNVLTKTGTISLMRRAADWQLANPPKPKCHLLDWHYGAFFVGLMDLYDQTGDEHYRTEMYSIGNHYHWKTLNDILHADRIAIIDMYERLYEKDKDPAIIEKAKWAMDIIMSRGTTKKVMVNLKDNVYYDEWLTWCDALFMSPPVFARMTNITGEQKYINYMNTMWWKTSDYLYSKQDSLFYRDDRFFNKLSDNGKKIFWSRGNGWVIAALTRILKVLPQDSPYRPKFEQQFKEMAHKILSLQRPQGLWTVSLLDPEYLPMGESSGSAFYTYALAYGLNSGLLDTQYLPQVEKAWKALCANVNKEGCLGYVQQVAGDPYPFKPEEFHVYATGAFLMAGKEMCDLFARGFDKKIKNPLIDEAGMSDPHMLNVHDTLFLFSGHDIGFGVKNWVMPDWRIYQSTDLKTWKHVGTIRPEDNYMGKGNTNCWAGDIVARNGKYYWYFSNRKLSTGVMVASRPEGPYVDALKKPLVDSFDPTIFIDDDNTPYIIYGEVDYKIARLKNSMIELDEEPKTIQLDRKNIFPKTDKNSLHKHNGIYYLSVGGYYATSMNVYGPYEYKGLTGDGFGVDSPYAHGDFFVWKGEWFHVWCKYKNRDSDRIRDCFLAPTYYDKNGSMLDNLKAIDMKFR